MRKQEITAVPIGKGQKKRQKIQKLAFSTDLLWLKNNMTYSHFIHRHKFAVWCAARAVQRKFTKTKFLRDALDKCGVVEFVKHYDGGAISHETFDKFHENWCDSILKSWEADQVANGSYGRAAKLIAVYIKSMIVLQNKQTALSNIAHPPIDRMILQNISKDKSINHPNRMYWKAINWTELNKIQYKNLIKDLRQVINDKPFWVIEKYWPITSD